jgi:hypothetical protein
MTAERLAEHAADWTQWADIPEAQVWEAVALSLDFEPRMLPGHERHTHLGEVFNGCTDEFKRRLEKAERCVEGGTLKTVRRGNAPRAAMVNLCVFRAWGESLKHSWTYPPAFPRDVMHDMRRKLASARSFGAEFFVTARQVQANERAAQRVIEVTARLEKEAALAGALERDTDGGPAVNAEAVSGFPAGRGKTVQAVLGRPAIGGASRGPETQEQRQERRYKMCVDAGLDIPTDDYTHLPRGIGKIAEREGVRRQSFTEDVKAQIRRLNGR